MSTATRGSVGDQATAPGNRTFPSLLVELADARPGDVALQEKRYGIWQPTTWAEYRTRVRHMAQGLAELGVDRGDVVAVLGDNRPEWLIAEHAVQWLGAAIVGIHPGAASEEIAHVLRLTCASVVVAEDQEQVDKLVGIAEELPKLEAVVHYNAGGVGRYVESYLHSFVEVEEAGSLFQEANPGWLDERLSLLSDQDIAVICTTSGMTGLPKLAELTHANLLAMADQLQEVDPIDAADRYVSVLPLSWISEQMLGVACGLSRGLTLSFPEDSSTQRSDLREIGPHIMVGPPRIWESLLTEVQARIGEAGRLKRWAFGWGYARGDQMADRRTRGRKAGLGLAVGHRVADWIALRPVRDSLGLSRIRHCYCYAAGARLDPEVLRFFQALGINLKQTYGQTEIGGLAVLHRDKRISYTTVGEPLPRTELRIADDGEILLRSPSVFRGYHGDAAATSTALDLQGWLHTGGAGRLDDEGQLVIIDRGAGSGSGLR